MSLKTNLPNAKTLGITRYAISNAVSHARVSKALEEIGYGSEKLEEGKKLFEQAEEAFHACEKGKDLKKHFSHEFSRLKEELAQMFEKLRLKTRLIYLGNLDNKAEITFGAKGEFVKNILSKGISSRVSVSGGHSMNLEVMENQDWWLCWSSV